MSAMFVVESGEDGNDDRTDLNIAKWDLREMLNDDKCCVYILSLVF